MATGQTDSTRADRLLRRYLANGVRLDLNTTGTRLTFSHPGMGAVTVEAGDDGLVLHDPQDRPAPTLGDLDQ